MDTLLAWTFGQAAMEGRGAVPSAGHTVNKGQL